MKAPNHKAGIAALVTGGLITALSSALITARKGISDTETCGTQLNGEYGCSSPRDDMTFIGVTGLMAGIGLAGAR